MIDLNGRILEQKEMERSCPQGSVLGSKPGPPYILWNLVVDDLISSQHENIDFVAYAHDILIIVRDSDHKNLQARTNVILQHLHDWAVGPKIIVNVKKCFFLFQKKL